MLVQKYIVLEILGSKKNLGPKKGAQTNLGTKSFMSQKIVVSKKKLGPKIFWVQKILDSKNFGSKNILGSKYFRSKIFLVQQHFWYKECGSKFGQNQISIVGGVFHYTETRKNVAGTNGTLPYVPMTVAKYYRWPNQPTLNVWLSSDK